MYNGHLQALIRELLADFRIVYLIGPRQAGKTTLARSVAGELGIRYFTLDDQAVLHSIRSDPHGFVRSLNAARVVFDEFQYALELIPAIKEASDRLTPEEKGKFLLTDSADIFRSARAQEALPGHMARMELYPLSISEIAAQRLNLVDYPEFTNGLDNLRYINDLRCRKPAYGTTNAVKPDFSSLRRSSCASRQPTTRCRGRSGSPAAWAPPASPCARAKCARRHA